MVTPEDILLAEDFLYEWIESTEKIIGSVIIKKGVKVSDPDQENIRLILQNLGQGLYEITFISRESLRFVDMGAGSGYNKGVRQPSKSTREPTASARKPKKILTKPFFSRLNSLQSVLVSYVTQMADFNIEKFRQLTTTINVL
ncbi:hypothetical protein VB796_08615 [Arcicella sp. LKC2W]|uniref:hypothetical protein n=1 Tax=Arcicella sp. LKC2W TaxID=2984198 RepID=UPI002B1FAFE9|nr:hypothetical protein [Arcicella sp. LKC2W]MEA5459096.1 hypothetical protein [Arcicella sp. LKC2W]